MPRGGSIGKRTGAAVTCTCLHFVRYNDWKSTRSDSALDCMYGGAYITWGSLTLSRPLAPLQREVYICSIRLTIMLVPLTVLSRTHIPLCLTPSAQVFVGNEGVHTIGPLLLIIVVVIIKTIKKIKLPENSYTVISSS